MAIPRPVKKLFLLLVAFGLLVVFAVTVSIVLLPRLLSSQRFAELLEVELQRTFLFPVRIADSLWTWDNGLVISDLRIYGSNELTEDFRLASIGSLRLFVDWQQIAAGHLGLELAIVNPSFTFTRYPDGATNIDYLIRRWRPASPATSSSPGAYRFILDRLRELEVHFRVSGIRLTIDDQGRRQTLAVEDGTLSVDGTLPHKGILLSCVMPVTRNATALPPLVVKARIENFIGRGFTPTPAMTTADIVGELPGLQLQAKGGLFEQYAEGHLVVAIDRFQEAFAAFLPAAMPAVDGRFEAHFTGKKITSELVSYDLRLLGVDLTASGGRLGDRRLGPLAVELSQQGTIDVAGGKLVVDTGTVRLFDNSGFSWQGEAAIKEDLALTIKDVSLDLGRIADLAMPFIPESYSLSLVRPVLTVEEVRLEGFFERLALQGIRLQAEHIAVAGRNFSAAADGLDCKGATVRGDMDFLAAEKRPATAGGRDNPGTIALAGLVVETQKFIMTKDDLAFNGNTFGLVLNDSEITFGQGLPPKAHASLALKGTNWHLKSAENHLQAAAITIAAGRIAGHDIKPASGVNVPIAGAFSLDAETVLTGMQVDDILKTAVLRQAFSSSLVLSQDGAGSLAVARASLAVSDIAGEKFPAAFFGRPLELEMFRASAEIRSLSPFAADIEAPVIGITGRDLFDATLAFSGKDLGRTQFNCQGNLHYDAENVLPVLPLRDILINAAGKSEIAWKVSGHLPDAGFGFLAGETPIIDRLKELDFIDYLEVTKNVTDFQVHLALPSQASLRLAGIHSDNPLTLISRNGLSDTSIQGTLTIGEILEIPGIGDLQEPLELQVEIDGRQEKFQQLRLTENFRLEPLHLEQHGQFILTNLASLENFDFSRPASWLWENIQLRVASTIKGNLDREYEVLPRQLWISGSASADLAAELDGGKSLRLKSFIATPGLAVRVRDIVRIDGLESGLGLEKRYDLLQESAGSDQPLPKSFLSTAVLRGENRKYGESDGLAKRRRPEFGLQPSAVEPSIAFSTARVTAWPVDLKLSNYRLALRLVDGLPVADRVEFQVGGGDLIGSVGIYQEGRQLVWGGAWGFTGIEAARLAPGLFGSEAGESAISGQLSVRLPLSADLAVMLKDLQASLEFTEIGPRALADFLTILDPHDQHEIIARQKSLLQYGFPRWVKIGVKDGALSLTGEIAVKGVAVAIPALDRFNISELPDLEKFVHYAGPLQPLINILRISAAAQLTLDQQGRIQPVQ